MQRVHIDIVGPLPRSKKGNCYILTLQCSYTKWAEAFPLKNQKPATCARAIIDGWVNRYGVPDDIYSDQGRNFESQVFKEMCQLLGIRKTRTTAYHPAGNGQGENWNRTLKGLLKAKVDGNVERWDEQIGACLMAYRSSVHRSTGYTPFHLMYGREMKLPLDIMMGVPDQEEHTSYGDFATKLKQNLTEAYQHVRENLQTAQCRQKEYYDRVVKDSEFQSGDQVYLYSPALKPGEAAKFHRNWKGPFTVLERVAEVTYKIQKLGGPSSTAKIVHFNNLKLYKRKAAVDKHQTAPKNQVQVEINTNDRAAQGSEHNKVESDEENDDEISNVEAVIVYDTQSREAEQAEPESVLLDDSPPTEIDQEDTFSMLDESVEEGTIEGTEIADSDLSDRDGEEGGRPQRSRRPPERYGDWICASIELKDTVTSLQERLELL